MQRIKPEILEKAFEIGFNFKKQQSWDKASVDLPCCVTLDSGETIEIAELILTDKLYRPELFKIINIEQIESIRESKYALSKAIRSESLNTQEYRNDYPFFIRKKDNGILGFNAYSPVNFTYKENVLGSDIVEIVSFQNAQEESFELIRNHSEIPVQIICGYNPDIVNLIEKINYS